MTIPYELKMWAADRQADLKVYCADHPEVVAGVLCFVAGVLFVRVVAFLRPREKWGAQFLLVQRVCVGVRSVSKSRRRLLGFLAEGLAGSVMAVCGLLVLAAIIVFVTISTMITIVAVVGSWLWVHGRPFLFSAGTLAGRLIARAIRLPQARRKEPVR